MSLISKLQVQEVCRCLITVTKYSRAKPSNSWKDNGAVKNGRFQDAPETSFFWMTSSWKIPGRSMFQSKAEFRYLITETLDAWDPALEFGRIKERIEAGKIYQGRIGQYSWQTGDKNRVNMRKTALFGFMDTGQAPLREKDF